MPHFETLAVRTQTERTAQNEHSTPLFLTSSFTFDSVDEGAALFSGLSDGNLYSRFSNPNSDEFARKIALLEGTETAVATATGMSAIFTVFASLLKAGDHIVCSKLVFGNTTHILSTILPQWGISTTFVNPRAGESWEEALRPETRLLFVETPTNPTLDVLDLAELSNLCRAHDLLFVVDNCFATPYLQQPAAFGADLIVHSATKWIDGQGRVLGGAITGPSDLIDSCYAFIRRTGPSMSPFNAWVLSKSLETLSVRMDRHCENALSFAKHFEHHPAIERVIYPGLPSHAQHELACQQMKAGGGLVSLELKGGLKRGRNVLNDLVLFSKTANLGDTRSIATHPASTTHSSLSASVREAIGITDGLLRISIGLERIDDLIEDFERSLS